MVMNKQASQTAHEDMGRKSRDIVKTFHARREKSLDTSEGLICLG